MYIDDVETLPGHGRKPEVSGKPAVTLEIEIVTSATNTINAAPHYGEPLANALDGTASIKRILQL